MAPSNTETSLTETILHNGVENVNGLNKRKVILNNNNIDKDEKRTQCDKLFDIDEYERMEFKAVYRWPDLTVQILLHTVSLYGILLILLGNIKFVTLLFTVATIIISAIGITAGVHRLWSHRSYKAKLPLRILLAILFSITGQRDLYTWALDHRLHHKYTETVADPHDARRGFLFAHIGWLVLTPHPAVVNRRIAAKEFCKDMMDDPVVKIQKILNIPLFGILNIALPTLIPYYYWNESLLYSFVICFVLRFTITLNIAFCVNSVAHIYGNKPYDRFINSTESFTVSVAALGEGWHNYHHVFPWDYRASELGRFNISTKFIDFAAKLDLVSGRKAATQQMIESRCKRTGDGTRAFEHDEKPIWGYGDQDIPTSDIQQIDSCNTIKL